MRPVHGRTRTVGRPRRRGSNEAMRTTGQVAISSKLNSRAAGGKPPGSWHVRDALSGSTQQMTQL